MTTQEFSNEFDTLLNSYYSQITPGEQFSKADLVLDEYEKSIFLTQAQEDIVLGLYNGTLNGEPFESTEISRRYLDKLIKVSKPTLNKGTSIKLNNSSYIYDLPIDLWFIIYEHIVSDSKIIEVIPIEQDDWHRVKNNPFKGPTNKRAVRLDIGNNTVEIISIKTPSEYLISYLSKPKPIILEDLPEDLSINNNSEENTCELHESLHRLILERAVQLAISRVSKASK